MGNSRPYAYLTAGLPVKRGDLVRVPYGKKNEPKEGIVRSVGDYTHDTAPWSPEKAKRVLEILPKPQVSVKKESTVPKPQQEHTKPEEPAHSAAPAPAGAVQDATRPTRKYGRIAIIVICFVLVGWLIFLAAQDVPKAQPAAVAPAASRTDSSSIATTPTASYAQYSGKLPVEGMPMKALSYTSLGAPDKELKCKNFEKLEPNRKYINVYWYDDSGELIAAGMCAQWEGDSEFVLKSFSQYYPTQPYEGQTFHSGSATDIGSGSGQSLREDYGDPEDLYEDGDYDEDTVMMDALEAGAADFTADGPVFEITTDPDAFNDVIAALEAKGYTFASADISLIPQTYVKLTSEEDIKNMEKLLDMLEDNEDVQNTYHNWETED